MGIAHRFIARIFKTGLVLSLLGIYLYSWASLTKLSPEARSYLLRDGAFKEVSSVKNLPASVLLKFAEIAKDSNLKIADPSERFQITDVIYERELPSRRLIWSVLGKDYCVIHYERGGIGHAYYVVLFKRSGDDAQFLWGAANDNKIKNLPELRELLKTGTLDDSLPYSW